MANVEILLFTLVSLDAALYKQLKGLASQCVSPRSHLALYRRNSSYILMTNLLAAGLVLPGAVFISLRGGQERRGRGERKDDGSGGAASIKDVAEANVNIQQFIIFSLAFLAVYCVYSTSIFICLRGTKLTNIVMWTIKWQ